MATEIAMFNGVPIIVKSIPLHSLGTEKCSSAVPMIVVRSGAEMVNFEWLEKFQCSSGVPIIVKSVPLLSVGTGKCSSACTNDCGTERIGDGKY